MTHKFLKGFISRSWRVRISTKNARGPATSTRPEATLGIGQEGPGVFHRLHLARGSHACGEGVQGTRNEGNEESRQGRRESAQGQAGGTGAQSGTAGVGGSPYTGGSHQGDASSPSRRGGARQEARGGRGNSPPPPHYERRGTDKGLPDRNGPTCRLLLLQRPQPQPSTARAVSDAVPEATSSLPPSGRD